MKKTFASLASIAVLCAYTLTFVGCSNSAEVDTPPATPTSQDDHDHDHPDDDHDHDDHEGHDHDDHAGHDHDDHAGHDHPAHGPNGGHMIDLTGGAHAEWAHDDENDLITVFPENPDAVTSVAMKTNIDGNETVYDFEKKEIEGKTVFQIVSPELLTAVKMGKAVDTKLVVTTDEGEATAQVEHHAH